jgi:hypothetical protein
MATALRSLLRLFDTDLDAVAVTLHKSYSVASVGKMWARSGQPTAQQTEK